MTDVYVNSSRLANLTSTPANITLHIPRSNSVSGTAGPRFTLRCGNRGDGHRNYLRIGATAREVGSGSPRSPSVKLAHHFDDHGSGGRDMIRCCNSRHWGETPLWRSVEELSALLRRAAATVFKRHFNLEVAQSHPTPSERTIR